MGIREIIDVCLQGLKESFFPAEVNLNSGRLSKSYKHSVWVKVNWKPTSNNPYWGNIEPPRECIDWLLENEIYAFDFGGFDMHREKKYYIVEIKFKNADDAAACKLRFES